MLELLIADATRRTSVPTVRERNRTDWLAVAVWAVGVPLVSAACWAVVAWAIGAFGVPLVSVAAAAGVICIFALGRLRR